MKTTYSPSLSQLQNGFQYRLFFVMMKQENIGQYPAKATSEREEE